MGHSINRWIFLIKAKYIFFFFFRIFPHKCRLHCLELVYSKNYFGPIQNGDKSNKFSRHEQRSVIKFLVAEKCKPYEIHRKICDVYQEACFSPNVYKWTKHWFAATNLSEKDSPLDFLVNKKFRMQQSAKKVMLTEFHIMKGPIIFPWKRCNCKQCFLLPTL